MCPFRKAVRPAVGASRRHKTGPCRLRNARSARAPKRPSRMLSSPARHRGRARTGGYGAYELREPGRTRPALYNTEENREDPGHPKGPAFKANASGDRVTDVDDPTVDPRFAKQTVEDTGPL